MPPDATFVALPEGITLNYLSRRPTTVPVINFMMTEMIVFGEDAITNALARRPPDYVVLVDKDTSEFGVGAFGVDPRYGQRVMAICKTPVMAMTASQTLVVCRSIVTASAAPRPASRLEACAVPREWPR